MLLYQGEKLVGKIWVIVVGMRTNKAQVIELLEADKKRDHSLGGLIKGQSSTTRYRIVKYQMLSQEEL